MLLNTNIIPLLMNETAVPNTSVISPICINNSASVIGSLNDKVALSTTHPVTISTECESQFTSSIQLISTLITLSFDAATQSSISICFAISSISIIDLPVQLKLKFSCMMIIQAVPGFPQKEVTHKEILY